MSVEARNDLKLLLKYNTGETKLFDATPYATGGWFGELGDPHFFQRCACFLMGRALSGRKARILRLTSYTNLELTRDGLARVGQRLGLTHIALMVWAVWP